MQQALRRIGLLASVLLGLALYGCTSLKAAEDAQARDAIAALQRGDWNALDPQLSPVIAGDPQLHVKLQQVRTIVPIETPARIQLIKVQKNARWGGGARARTSSLTYLYIFPHQALVVNIVFDRTREAPTIAGLHVAPVDPKATAANRFLAPGKTAGQWAFLAACILSPVLMVVAAVAAWRSKALATRWLWVLLSFVGVGNLVMNWASGELRANLLAVNLIGAGVMRAMSLLTPWYLQMTLPVGAAAVLVRVWTLRRRPTPQERTFT